MLNKDEKPNKKPTQEPEESLDLIKTTNQLFEKWQSDWQEQTKKWQDKNQQNQENFQKFIENQRKLFDQKITEMDQKREQNAKERQEKREQFKTEWNHFVKESQKTYKILSKSRERVFWRTLGYWMIILFVILAILIGILWVLRYLKLIP